MSESCSNQCGECSLDCADRKSASSKESPNELSNVKKVIGIVSGKGGVGKSMVTSLLSIMIDRKSTRLNSSH